jgi:hypothetical protein
MLWLSGFSFYVNCLEAKFEESGRLDRLKNLNNINVNVNGWANSEIVHIIREQNTEIAWALDSRKSDIQLSMFSKLHATVDYGSLECNSLGSVHSSCEN